MRLLLSILLLVMGVGSVSTAQEDEAQHPLSDLVLVDVLNLSELDLQGRLSNAKLSPDGNFIAYEGEEGICILAVDLRSSACPEYFPDQRPPRVLSLMWSPDSRFIAIEQPSLQFLQDGDIILYDLETAQYINRTDDGRDESLGFIGERTEEPPPPVDISPTWADESGDLYFIRWLSGEDEDIEELMRIPGPGAGSGFMGLGGGDVSELTSDIEPEAVLRLSDVLENPLTIYTVPPALFDGPIAVSPQGDRIAMVVRDRSRDSTQSGIWIYDIPSGEFTQVIAQDELLGIGLPTLDQDTFRFELASIEWTNAGILLWTSSQMLMNNVMTTVFQIDDTDFRITPVFPLAQFDDMGDYLARENIQGLMRPMLISILPDESALIYAESGSLCNNFPAYCGIWAMPLPYSADNNPVLLAEIDPESTVPANFELSVGASDDRMRVLVHNLVYTFEYEN